MAKSLASNADVPPKSPETKKVEVPNPKVLEAKDKKKGLVGKVVKPAGGTGGSKPPAQKRGGSNIASLLRKKQKPDADVSVVDLDASDDVHSPDPITAIPTTGSGKKVVAAAAGTLIYTPFFFLLFPPCFSLLRRLSVV